MRSHAAARGVFSTARVAIAGAPRRHGGRLTQATTRSGTKTLPLVSGPRIRFGLCDPNARLNATPAGRTRIRSRLPTLLQRGPGSDLLCEHRDVLACWRLLAGERPLTPHRAEPR